jgi:hypothetical protein
LGILLVGRRSTLGVRAQEKEFAGVIGGSCAPGRDEEREKKALTARGQRSEREGRGRGRSG